MPASPLLLGVEPPGLSYLHFCRSSARRVALLGFRFNWKCLTGGAKGPAKVVKAFLFKYWHSKGSMAEDSQSLTRSKYRIRKEFSLLERQTRRASVGMMGKSLQNVKEKEGPPPSRLPNEELRSSEEDPPSSRCPKDLREGQGGRGCPEMWTGSIRRDG